MNTNIILYNTETDKTYFKLGAGIRPWGILLAISKGSFRLSFPALGQTHVIHPYEISYIPPNTEFCREVIEPIDFHQFAFQMRDCDDPLGRLEAGRLPIPSEQVQAILQSADRISRAPTDADRLATHMLHRILTDHYLFSPSTALPRISRDLLSATNYIFEHLDKPLSVALLADSLHLSHNGLIWKFKKELGTTPVKYIAMCRMKRAKQLLFEGDLSISQIAEACGYANGYYFSNAFKKSEGLSPSDFRKKCMK